MCVAVVLRDMAEWNQSLGTAHERGGHPPRTSTCTEQLAANSLAVAVLCGDAALGDLIFLPGEQPATCELEDVECALQGAAAAAAVCEYETICDRPAAGACKLEDMECALQRRACWRGACS